MSLRHDNVRCFFRLRIQIMAKRLTKFPMYRRGNQYWESLLESMDRSHLHEQSYDGAKYYEEWKLMMIGMDEGKDVPWCCEYTKKTFVAAWDEVQVMVEEWHKMDDDGVPRHEQVRMCSSAKYRSNKY